MKTIYVASPYCGDVENNTELARKALLHGVLNNTVPIAPHLLYPQILDDNDEDERNLGKQLALELLLKCDELWVYGDRISSGMQAEIDVATEFKIPVLYIKNWE